MCACTHAHTPIEKERANPDHCGNGGTALPLSFELGSDVPRDLRLPVKKATLYFIPQSPSNSVVSLLVAKMMPHEGKTEQKEQRKPVSFPVPFSFSEQLPLCVCVTARGEKVSLPGGRVHHQRHPPGSHSRHVQKAGIKNSCLQLLLGWGEGGTEPQGRPFKVYAMKIPTAKLDNPQTGQMEGALGLAVREAQRARSGRAFQTQLCAPQSPWPNHGCSGKPLAVPESQSCSGETDTLHEKARGAESPKRKHCLS